MTSPYREYVVQAGPPWPVLSMASGVALGGFGAFTCVAIIVTRGWLFRFDEFVDFRPGVTDGWNG